MAHNGYKNWETWMFMMYFGDYLYEVLQDQQEQQEQNDLDFQTVYETVASFIDEMYDSVDENRLDGAFLNDLLNGMLRAIDIKEVAHVLAQELKD